MYIIRQECTILYIGEGRRAGECIHRCMFMTINIRLTVTPYVISGLSNPTMSSVKSSVDEMIYSAKSNSPLLP